MSCPFHPCVNRRKKRKKNDVVSLSSLCEQKEKKKKKKKKEFRAVCQLTQSTCHCLLLSLVLITTREFESSLTHFLINDEFTILPNKIISQTAMLHHFVQLINRM